MSEDVARMVGAGSSESVTINGKECFPRPLTLVELTEIERDCLKMCKRRVIETFSENADLLPESIREARLIEKMDEVSTWDLSNLPKKWTYDPRSIVVTPELTQWLERELNFKPGMYPKDKLELVKARLVVTALDEERMTIEEYKKLSPQSHPRKYAVGYVEWWITGSLEGISTLVWKCFQHQCTREEVMTEMMKNPAIMRNAACEIEALTAPALVGN